MKTRSQDDVARLIQVFSLDGVSYREFGEPAGFDEPAVELTAHESPRPGGEDDDRALARARGRLGGPKDLPLAAVFAGLVREGRREEPVRLAPVPEPTPTTEPTAVDCPPSTPLSAVFQRLAAQGERRSTGRRS